METPPPPPDATTTPLAPPERRCPRCGSTLAPDQEWCLACGAAAGTEVVETRGWRVPIYLGGGLVALAVLGVILAIAALSNQEEPTGNGTPTPAPSAQPPGTSPTAAPTISPIPATPTPTVTAVPTETPTVEASPTETPTVDPAPTDTPDPGGSSTFGGWTGTDGDYTIIIESADSISDAEKVAQKAQDGGLTVGILNSDDYSSLNGGYQVVFTGTYATEADAEADLDSVRNDFSDAYVKQIKT
ncbi:SPOR domain-containing protein [Solirubrobacter taibaiensis]|nr:SPOR domain-containing protein [Solirubrobacter taibaiensis]